MPEEPAGGLGNTTDGSAYEGPIMGCAWDHAIGGVDHRAVDREFMVAVREVLPGIDELCRNVRTFSRAVVAHLADRGVDQYLELGSGLPTVDPVHAVAARHLPDGRTPRVVYVDNDTRAVAHARRLLADVAGVAAVVGDVTDSAALLADPELVATLDLSRPVAVLACGLLYYVADADAARLVATLRRTTAPGSSLAMTAITDQGRGEISRWAAHVHSGMSYPPRLRTPPEMTAWLQGWHVPPPGWCSAPHWRADATEVIGADVAGSGHWAVLAHH